MSDLRTLIEAARNDAPSAAARANVWAGVSTVVGEAAAASGAGAATGAGGAAKKRGAVEATPHRRPAPLGIAPLPAARTAGFDGSKRAVKARALPPVSDDEVTDSDALAREASSLAEARAALARRDALAALQIVRGLRALPGRQLVPEELAVEAQALRGLGLDDDASAVETLLRARFPDSVLGR